MLMLERHRQQVGIAFPPPMPPTQTLHNLSTGLVEHHDMKPREYLQHLLQPFVRWRRLGGQEVKRPPGRVRSTGDWEPL